MSIQSEINRITTAVSDQESLIGEIVDALAKRCVVTEPLLQAKTVTPTEEVQTVTPDNGYDGLSSVTVEAGVSVSGEISITENGVYDVAEYASANVAIPTEAPVLLWTNASPTSSFADQTVAVGGSGFGAYLAEARWDTATATSQITLIRKSSSDQIISVTTGEPNSAIRFIKSATDSGITFSYHGGTGMAKCIPTHIWGVNFTL